MVVTPYPTLWAVDVSRFEAAPAGAWPFVLAVVVCGVWLLCLYRSTQVRS